MAVEECYSFWNTQGSATGNCGSTSTAFIPCDQRLVKETATIVGLLLWCTSTQYTNILHLGYQFNI